MKRAREQGAGGGAAAEERGGTAPSEEGPRRALAMLLSLDCCVCLEPILPPVYQCMNGHLYCDGCLAALEAQPEQRFCALCRAQLPPHEGRVRCLFADTYANGLMYPCPYQALGCKSETVPAERAAHVRTCKHNPLWCVCPSGSACWEGLTSQLEEHLRKKHGDGCEGAIIKFRKALLPGHCFVTDHSAREPLASGKENATDFVLCKHVYLSHDCFLLREVEVAGGLMSFSVSTIGYLTEEASRHQLRYELRIGSDQGEEKLHLKARVPQKAHAPHKVPLCLQLVERMQTRTTESRGVKFHLHCAYTFGVS